MAKSKKNTSLFKKINQRLKSSYIKCRHFWLHTKLGKGILIFIFIYININILLAGWYYFKYRNDPYRIGVSFSYKYARELNVNWQENFTALLDDLKFRDFRLMSYWDIHEPKNNQFDFSILDWQMDEAAKRGAKVSLAIGERQPRWPECHHPKWALGLTEDNFNKELLEYLHTVVNRYKNHPALDEYQLENEIYNVLFGDCEPVKRSRLQAEYDLVKSLDKVHPISINVASQEGTPPIRQPIGDTIGFSVYRIAAGKLFGLSYYWHSWYFLPQWHTVRAAFVELVHGSPTFIHELQTEPWGPEPTISMTSAQQDESMSPEIISNNVDFAKSTGIKRFYLWGGEWWYWRMIESNDKSPWDNVKQILHDNNKEDAI